LVQNVFDIKRNTLCSESEDGKIDVEESIHV